MLILLIASVALADTSRPVQQGPVGVLQATPGVHISLVDGHLGVGASVDLLAGIVFGERAFNLAPGVVAGPFAELNAVLKQGVTLTGGARGGVGALAPTARLGFIPYGLVAVDHGRCLGATQGVRWGMHARVLYGGVGGHRYADGTHGFSLGAELPLLPVPVVY